MWEELGLEIRIETAAANERPGSVILEELLCSELPGEGKMPTENGVETVMVAAWYLWWDRRRISHEEKCGTLVRTTMSIRGIVANSLAAKAKEPARKLR